MQGNSLVHSSINNSVAANGQTGDIDIQDFNDLLVVTQLTALTGGTAPTVQFIVEWKDSQGVYRPLATHAALSAVGTKIMSTGSGVATTTGIDAIWSAPFGLVIRVRWAVTGAPATATASFEIIGSRI